MTTGRSGTEERHAGPRVAKLFSKQAVYIAQHATSHPCARYQQIGAEHVRGSAGKAVETSSLP
jgi:hypothetical protein